MVIEAWRRHGLFRELYRNIGSVVNAVYKRLKCSYAVSCGETCLFLMDGEELPGR